MCWQHYILMIDASTVFSYISYNLQLFFLCPSGVSIHSPKAENCFSFFIWSVLVDYGYSARYSVFGSAVERDYFSNPSSTFRWIQKYLPYEASRPCQLLGTGRRSGCWKRWNHRTEAAQAPDSMNWNISQSGHPTAFDSNEKFLVCKSIKRGVGGRGQGRDHYDNERGSGHSEPGLDAERR